MIQLTGRARLLLEAMQPARILRERLGDRLGARRALLDERREVLGQRLLAARATRDVVERRRRRAQDVDQLRGDVRRGAAQCEGVGGLPGITTSVGRRVVYVPAEERRRAQEILEEPVREEPEDNPILRMIVIVAIIVGLLLATPFVAQACYPAS